MREQSEELTGHGAPIPDWDARPYADLPLADGIVIVIDRCGIVRFATHAAGQYLDDGAGELAGRSVLDFITPAEHAALEARWQTLLSSPDTTFDELVVTLDERLKHVQPLRVGIWRLPEKDEFLLVFYLSDHLRDRLETLYTILVALSGALTLDQVYDVVLNEVLRLIPCDHCALLVVGPDGALQDARSVGPVLHVETPDDSDQILKRATIQTLRATGKPLIIPDCHNNSVWERRPASSAIRSWLGVPLIHRGEFLGALNLDSRRLDFFTQEDAALAQALATQVAAAIAAARQYESELRRAERFRAISEISLAISQLDLASVLEIVYRKVSGLMDASSFYIGLYDAESEQLRIVGSYEHGERIPDAVQHAGEGLTGLVLRTRKRMIIHDSAVEPIPETVIIDGDVPRSLLMFPLMTQEHPVGVISVQSYQPHAYTAGDIALMETIAGAVATAIDNAQLYNATAGQLAALETLHQMSLRLASVQPRERVAELVLEAVMELFAPSEACLFLASDPPHEPEMWEGCVERGSGELPNRARNPSHDTLAQQITATGRPVILHDLDSMPTIAAARERPTRALAGYPLVRGDSRLGALMLYYDRPQFFRATTLRTLELLCMQAATALENASYYQRLRRQLDEVSALHDLAREVSSSEALDDMLQLVTRRMRDVYDCRSAAIALYEPDSDQVVIRAAVGLEPQYLAAARFEMGEFVAGHVVATGEVIYVPDTHHEPNFRVIDPGVRSILAVPLTVHDQVIGTLSVDSGSPNAFTAEHERLLTIAGSQLAAAIETLRLLEETRQRAAQLADANKTLRAVDALRDELVQNVSHELRSPLALVRGYAGLMRDGELGAVSPEQADALAMIEQKAESISRLINDILSLETIRRDNLELGLVDLAAIAEQAVNGARLVYGERGFTFVCETAPGDYTVEGDRDRLTQVIDNLLGNAIKFSPPGTTITVRVTPGEAPGSVTIEVIDQGIGIPAEKLDQIFERFYQVEHTGVAHGGGAGLGLSIVQRILEAHGGSIRVTSVEGQGSTFTCTLPLAYPTA